MADSVVVLHVDDDPAFTELTATFLEREDDRFEVETATSAAEALDQIEGAAVDCIVSDYDMPGENGIEFLESVRESHPDLPFILFTGKGSEEVASEAISAGVTDYLQKVGGTDHYKVLANRIDNVVRQQEAERVVEQTKRRLSEIAENTTDVLWMFSGDWDELHFINSAYEDIWGRPVEALDADPRDFLNGVHPEDRDAVVDAMDRLTNGESIDFEFRVNQDEGYDRWVWGQGDPIIDDEGSVVRVSGFARDVTDRKERERELRQLKEEYETVFNTAQDGIFLIDVIDTGAEPEFQFRRLNPAHEQISGLSTEEIRGQTPREVLGEEFGAEVAANYRRCVEAAGPISYNEVIEMPARTIHWQTKLGPVTTDGEVTQIVGVARDITDQKAREEELRSLQEDYENQYRELFKEAPVMFAFTRNEGGTPIIDDCNRKFAERLGYPRSDLIGRPLASVYTEDSEQALIEEGGYDRALSGEFTKQEREFRTADGETVTTLLRASPRRNRDGDIIGTHALFVDVTDQERAAELQRQNERLDEFASIVSHDLRNPLTVAQGQVELIRDEYESEHLDELDHSLERMQTLIDDLLRLAREGTRVEEQTAVDLGALIDGCCQNVETMAATIENGVTHTIRADPSRLKQLIENLVRNAVEHGGRGVTIRLDDLPDGFYIDDDGVGIPAADRDRVFEAGFSGTEDGTGFGLNIVEQIVEAHDWDITVTEGTDGGARFEITGIDLVAPEE